MWDFHEATPLCYLKYFSEEWMNSRARRRLHHIYFICPYHVFSFIRKKYGQSGIWPSKPSLNIWFELLWVIEWLRTFLTGWVTYQARYIPTYYQEKMRSTLDLKQLSEITKDFDLIRSCEKQKLANLGHDQKKVWTIWPNAIAMTLQIWPNADVCVNVVRCLDLNGACPLRLKVCSN